MRVFILMFAIELICGVGLYAQENASPVGASGLHQSERTLITLNVLGIVSTFGGFAYAIYRDNQKRKWDLQDREYARMVNRNQVTEIKQKIDDNTKLSEAALNDRAAVDRKIEELTQLFLSEQKPRK